MMIRLPPTGISLSASDLDVHLHQINVYHGLLKQGFKKRDVLRYFKEQRELEQSQTHDRYETAIRSPTHPIAHYPAVSAPFPASEPHMATIRLVDQDEVISELQPGDESVEGSSTLTASHRFAAGSPNSDEDYNFYESSQIPSYSSDSQNTGESCQSPSSVVTSRDPVQVRHAPRQSSLLRFAHTMYSDPAEAEVRSQHPGQLIATFRHMSSEVVDQDSENESVVDRFDALVIDNSLPAAVDKKWTPNRLLPLLNPEAPEFTPLSLPSPISNMYRTPSGRPSPASVIRLQVHVSTNADSQSTTPSTSWNDTRDLAGSPPIFQESTTSMLDLIRTPPALPVTPARPISRFNGSRAVSEPHNQRRQHLDGATFTVYDDSMPAGDQPQTPADLSRRPGMNEFNAMYTAPPGVIHGTGFQSHLRSAPLDIGEQSPTTRAVQIRSRRTREYARSVRVEGLRILRSRRRDYHPLQNDQQVLLRNNAEPLQNDRTETDFWRDDLEADRVGEENFAEEAEPSMLLVNELRVVSGNERPRGV